MGGLKISKDTLDALEIKARKVISNRSSEDLGDLSNDIKETIEKLYLYQAELEVQNEELREARHSLEQTEQNYYRHYDLAPVGLIRMDLTGKIIGCNILAADMLGLPRRTLNKGVTPLPMFLDGASRETFRDHLRLLKREDGMQACELKLLRENQSSSDIRMQSVPSFTEPDSQIILSTLTDISDIKRAEAQLELKDRAMEASTNGIVLADYTKPDMPLSYVNRGFCQMTGYTRAEVIGRNCRFLQGAMSDQPSLKTLRAAIKSGEPCTVTLKNFRKNGDMFWNELHLSPIKDSCGRITNYIGVQMDVTERKLLQEQFLQSQKLEAVGLLAGGIAHDFNNHLQSISMMAALLNDPEVDEKEISEFGDRISDVCSKAVRLTQKLLAFSRRSPLELTSVDMNDVVRGSRDVFSSLMGDSCEMRYDFAEKLWLIKGDFGQLEQVVMNLAINARDALPEIGGAVNISTSMEMLVEPPSDSALPMRPGAYVKLTLEDNGSGMPEEVREHLFEPFYTTKDVDHGTGLGLSTVYLVVKQHRGGICVDSVEGGGTKFSVYFPVDKTKDANSGVLDNEEASMALGLDKSRKKPTKGKVLLVEDNEDVRRALEMLIKSRGYQLTSCGSPQEGLKIAKERGQDLDALITDVVMPGIGGKRLAEAVVSENDSIKVLFVSGYHQEDTLLDPKYPNEWAFLKKPFSPSDLVDALAKLLDN